MVAQLLLDVQEHHDEEVEDQDGARIDQNLHRRDELGLQGHEQACHVKKHDQKRERAMHRIPQCDHQKGGHHDDAGEVEENNVCHDVRSSRVLGRPATCPMPHALWGTDAWGRRRPRLETIITFYRSARVRRFRAHSLAPGLAPFASWEGRKESKEGSVSPASGGYS